MSRLRLHTLLAIILFLFLALQPVEATQIKLEGKIVEEETQQGIAALSVKLTPPRESQQPQRITITNRDGEFLFSDLHRGKYMLEVRQGVTLLHRDIIDIPVDQPIKITLKVR